MKQKLATKTSGAELFSRFGILLIFAVVVIAAVSYTHLDVYKRQAVHGQQLHPRELQ